MATGQQKECKKTIYSELNYEEQRKKNLDQIENLYQKLLDQYSSVYQTYLTSNQDALADPSSPEAQNETDRNQVELKPKIKKLNEELIQIETEVLNNNKNVRQDIEEQKRQLQKESSQKNIIGTKLDKLDKMINNAETKSGTGEESVQELKNMNEVISYWYYALLILAACCFVGFVYFFWKVL